MNDQKQPQKMSDNTLLDEVKNLVRREKEFVVQVIEHLKEIELRKLHLARGYSSMFSFATEFLGYSEAEAHIRIQAARLTQTLPEVKSLIESGEISLSVVATAQSYFRKENLRRKELGKPALNIKEKREALVLVAGSSRREAEHNLNIHFAQPSTKTLQFQATPELVGKIDQLMNMMAHKNFDRDLGKMVEILVDAELERSELSRRKAQSSHSSNEKALSDVTTLPIKKGASESVIRVKTRNRYIPQKIRSLVWAKCKGECNYQDPLTGKKCSSKHAVQVDHKHAFSMGGSHSRENLTLLCFSHNVWKSNRQVE